MEMTDVLTVLREPLFWIVSSIGSLVLGVAGNLVTPRIARFLEQRSHSKQHGQRHRLWRFFGQVMIADGDQAKLTHWKLDAIYGFVLATFFLLLPVLVFVISGTAIIYWGVEAQLAIDIIVGIPLVWVSLFAAKEALKLIRIVRTAERRKRDIETWKHQYPSASPQDETAFVAGWDRQHIGMTLEEATAESNSNPLISANKKKQF